MENKTLWFEKWFNSPYYKILYSNRSYTEADAFVQLIHQKFDLKPQANILDWACGHGRHSISLARLGYNVVGVDLAPDSIEMAKNSVEQHNNPQFFVHDIRKPFGLNNFDAVLSLFTSVGYSDNDTENRLVVHNASQCVFKGGILLIDFFNAEKVKRELIPNEVITREGIIFNITRTVNSGFVIKEIAFRAERKDYCFTERVRLLDLEWFLDSVPNGMFEQPTVFGNYRLQPFDLDTSDRLIMVFRKK